jgi:hypothetical protein
MIYNYNSNGEGINQLNFMNKYSLSTLDELNKINMPTINALDMLVLICFVPNGDRRINEHLKVKILLFNHEYSSLNNLRIE